MVSSEVPSGKVPAIERAAKILDVLALGSTVSLAALTERVNLSKSSVSDLCSSLVSSGLIRRFHDQSFSLGPRVLDLAGRMTANHAAEDLLSARSINPHALESHTLSVEQLYGNEVLTLNVRMGRHPIRLTPRPGVRTPSVESAAGLAILGSMSRDRISAELDVFERNQGISAHERTIMFAAAAARTTRVAEWRQSHGLAQLAVAVGGDTAGLAISLHVPADGLEDAAVVALGRELTSFADSIG